ncbi:hypothetical protein [Allokutzneria albata]|uniref:Dolichyl-phosphate-mannose-protein mannosyltransferase n=1 Tax=Allokutzneria albata TaxID=211114 RepID=A0A1H0AAS4_ALLAB|nr:hypothetical protein [Allokutzneria albata]SDN29796.1 hypothetical protein SAMN04489726_5935 [Allokutzneria albata]
MLVSTALRTRAAALSAGRWPRVTAHATWVLLLSGWAVARIGRFGFHPTDQGFTLALSWRLLHGEVPHRDVVSARPLGSALLHTLDFLVPGPLFLVSTLIAMIELAVATIALAVLVTGRPVRTWGPLLTGLVAAASLVNLHTFPLMAWHTIDGILLVACGWWALRAGLRSGEALPRYGGLFLLGMAAFTKQSFVFAAAVTLTYLFTRHRLSILDLLWTAAFPLAYGGFVALSGGLRPMVEQLGGAHGAWPQRAFTVWEAREAMTTMLWAAGCIVAMFLLRRKESAVIPAVFTAVVAVLVVVQSDMLRAGDWGVVLLWVLIFTTAARWALDARAPQGALAVVALAVMSALSWGYDSPTLLGGTLALSVLCLLAPQLPTCSPGPACGVAVAVVVLLGTSRLLVDAHDASPYRDRPQWELSASLGRIAPALNGLRTNPSTYRYIAKIEACVRAHPASRSRCCRTTPSSTRRWACATCSHWTGRCRSGLNGRRITCGSFSGAWLSPGSRSNRRR